MGILQKAVNKQFSKTSLPTLDKSEAAEMNTIADILSNPTLTPVQKADLLSKMSTFVRGKNSKVLADCFKCEQPDTGQSTETDQATNLFPATGLGSQGPSGQGQPGSQITSRRMTTVREESYLPVQNPQAGGQVSAEQGQLQPPPQTAAGRSALAQRQAMKPREDEDNANPEFQYDGQTNPPARIAATPGQSGSSQVYRDREIAHRRLKAREHPALIPLKHRSEEFGHSASIGFRKSFMTSTSGDSYRVDSIYKGSDGKSWYLEGIASDGLVDLENDRMTPNALKAMEEALNRGVNVFVDHDHTVSNLIGTTVKGELRGNQLRAVVKLEDPDYNPLVRSILSKVDAGARLGFSIGGDLTESRPGWDGSKSVRDIDGVNLMELSVVGLPANPRSFVTGSSYKGA